MISGKNKYVMIILVLSIFLVSGCTSSEISRIADELQSGYDAREDYSAQVIKTNLLGEEDHGYELIVKDNRLFYKDSPETIASYDGENFYRYYKDTNTLYIVEEAMYPQTPDFNEILLALLDVADVTVGNGEYEGQPAYVFNVDAKQGFVSEVYYVEKNTYLMVKLDSLLEENQCQAIKDFLREHLNTIKNDCIYETTELRNYEINRGVDDSTFDLRNSVPSDAEIIYGEDGTIGTFGSCERDNKRIEEADFDVKLPTDLPERVTIRMPPEIVDQPHDDPCPESAALDGRYTKLSKLGIKYLHEKIDIATIILETTYEEVEESQIISKEGENAGEVVGTTTRLYNVTAVPGILKQSTSPWLQFWTLTSPHAELEKVVDINGNDATILIMSGGEGNLETRPDGEGKIMLWQDGDIYYLFDIATTGENTGAILTEDEFLAIARSLESI